MERDGDTVAVTVSGTRYRFPEVAEPVLTVLARERSLTVADLADLAGVPLDTAVGVVRALVSNQLVLVQET